MEGNKPITATPPGKRSSVNVDPCDRYTEEGPVTHREAGGEGSGKAFWSETQSDLKGGCVGLRSSGVCQRGQHFRQRGQFKKV